MVDVLKIPMLQVTKYGENDGVVDVSKVPMPQVQNLTENGLTKEVVVDIPKIPIPQAQNSIEEGLAKDVVVDVLKIPIPPVQNSIEETEVDKLPEDQECIENLLMEVIEEQVKKLIDMETVGRKTIDDLPQEQNKLTKEVFEEDEATKLTQEQGVIKMEVIPEEMKMTEPMNSTYKNKEKAKKNKGRLQSK